MAHLRPLTLIEALYDWHCAKCGREHRRVRKGIYGLKPQAYCGDCHAAYMRATRPRYADLPDDQKHKIRARSLANVYLNRGLIEPKPCEKCGDPNAEMHHEDYDQPLKVRWFCRQCHRALHHAEAP